MIDAPARPRLAYGLATLSAPAGAEGPITFVASTEKLNRYGFSLRHEGWRIDNFRANPVVLWMHDPFSPPIGRADASLESRRLRAAISFDQADPVAREVDRKYRSGFLNAVSVGFDFVKEDGSPIADWWRLSNEQIHDEVFYDLAEISAVTVPADAAAVKESLYGGETPTADAIVADVILDRYIRAAIVEHRRRVAAESNRWGDPF